MDCIQAVLHELEDDCAPYPSLPDETIDLVVPSGIMLWCPSDMASW